MPVVSKTGIFIRGIHVPHIDQGADEWGELHGNDEHINAVEEGEPPMCSIKCDDYEVKLILKC